MFSYGNLENFVVRKFHNAQRFSRSACTVLVECACGEGSMVLLYGLAAINIDMNGRICGALVQFGCYQHRHDVNVLKLHPYYILGC